MKIRACIVGGLVLAVAGVAAGQESVQMTFGDSKDKDPMISPDGNRIVFSSNRTGEFNLFTYDYGSSTTIQLTRSPKHDRYPSWSPDGKRIVFSANRTGNGDIYEIAADGAAGALQLTEAERHERHAGMSPRQNKLVLARSRSQGLIRKHMEVVLVDRDAGHSTSVVLGEGDAPRFSPDGSKIVFVSRRTKNDDVWLMDVDGGRQTQLTTDPKKERDPSFSPDGTQIVFASKRTGNFDIWAMDVNGSNLRQLTSTARAETQPCWSKENYIYFVRDDAGIR
jgi:Tol biopolymer transport system component